MFIARLVVGVDHCGEPLAAQDRFAPRPKRQRDVEQPWDEWAALLARVTGWDIDGDELHDTARGIVAAKHAFNRREGWTRAEDTLPARLLDVPLTLPSGREAALSRERMDAMVDAYYRTRGLELLVHEHNPAELPWP